MSPQYKLNWHKNSSLCLLLPLKISGGMPLNLSVVAAAAGAGCAAGAAGVAGAVCAVCWASYPCCAIIG